MSKLWGGRFTKGTNELVERFTTSINTDARMARDDIAGSIAHAMMLGKTGVIPAADSTSIVAGLKKILKRHEAEGLRLSEKDEDIHMNLERLLFEEIGPVAGKLHTARSRNDQVALDLRLYLRRAVVELVDLLVENQTSLIEKAQEHPGTMIPGYTHLQRAQPILLAHHLLAYVWMFNRDAARLRDLWVRLNRMPLGSGALAGTTFPIDRDYVTELLRFDGITENSLDTVSDRDLVVELLAALSLIMTHLSRLSEEFILWTSSEFGFLELDDAFTTGSSMMPQKKNPDVAELVRGKTGRVHGALVAVLTLLKGLPLSYNRDMQEDKVALFDALDTTTTSLALYAPMIATGKFDEIRLEQAVHQDYSNATDLADFLVRKGLPFREAHEVVGKVVLHALETKRYLGDIPLEEYRKFSPLLDEEIFEVLDPASVVAARKSPGGTSREAVDAQAKLADAAVVSNRKWAEESRKAIEIKITSD